MSREPETKWFSHLSLFVCFCLLFCTQGLPKLLLALASCFVCPFFFFEKRSSTFFSFRALLYLELCCPIQCNWKYINLFLIGCWTSDQLKNLSSGIFSSNTHLEWPHLDYEIPLKTYISSGKFVREKDYQRNICKEIC